MLINVIRVGIKSVGFIKFGTRPQVAFHKIKCISAYKIVDFKSEITYYHTKRSKKMTTPIRSRVNIFFSKCFKWFMYRLFQLTFYQY